MTHPTPASAPSGPVLAIETSWRIGSVALGVGELRKLVPM